MVSANRRQEVKPTVYNVALGLLLLGFVLYLNEHVALLLSLL